MLACRTARLKAPAPREALIPRDCSRASVGSSRISEILGFTCMLRGSARKRLVVGKPIHHMQPCFCLCGLSPMLRDLRRAATMLLVSAAAPPRRQSFFEGTLLI